MNLLGEQEKEQALDQFLESNISINTSPQKIPDWFVTSFGEKQAVKMVEKKFYGNMSYDTDFTAYIERMPTGELKDTVLQKMASSLSPMMSDRDFWNTEIEEVFSVVNKIGSKEKRDNAIENTLSEWTHKQPEKVRTLVEQSDLSPEKKKELVERCDRFIKNK